LLVTVPVPEEFEVPAAELERTLTAALQAAEDQGVGGHELTPFLLSSMSEASAGATLKANIALLENNARVAAAIAEALTA
jgi:pseudouridine-5'-phosphate glycosidase